MCYFTVYQAYRQQNLSISIHKILAKEPGKVNIRLSTRLWRILAAHEFDMRNIGFTYGYIKTMIQAVNSEAEK